MWRNYLTVGVRALLKHRTYALINILGLAIGMAACLMILLFVRYEFSYDKWLNGGENVYQIQSWYKNLGTGGDPELQMVPYAAGPAMKKDFPEVEAWVYGMTANPVVLKDGVPSRSERFMIVNDDLLQVIDLPLVRGDRRALGQPNAVILSQAEAVRRFGTEDVVGRTLTVVARGDKRDLRITGVFRDLPKYSHLALNTVARLDLPSYLGEDQSLMSCWGCQSGYIWMKLKPGADIAAMQSRMAAWEKRNIPDQTSGTMKYNPGDDQDFQLVNARDIHLGTAQGGAMTPGNDRGTILTFAVIALLILGMAIVNFTNLATARASQRAREVALRKVLGATRSQLVMQFIGESILISALAMLIALALVELTMPALASFLDADIHVSYFGTDGIILPVVVLMVLVGVLSGLYPAFFLSRYQPAQVLRANKSATETAGAGRLRTILVVAQFAVSIGLIVCTAVVYSQTVYARSADPGFKRDHILQVSGLDRYSMLTRGKAIEDRVRRIPGVTAVGRTGIGISTPNNSNTNVLVPGNAQPATINFYSVSAGLKDAMGLSMAAGRWFAQDREADLIDLPYPSGDLDAEAKIQARGGVVVINEMAARRLGFAKPEDAVGKPLQVGLLDDRVGMMPVRIIGVVKDARFRSVRTPLDPMFFYAASERQSHLMVRFDGDAPTVRRAVEQAWLSIAPDVPFQAEYSEDVIGRLYAAEDARAKTFAGFALLAVIVACLGLFGLAAFTAERRTKEIGMRKVLGARTIDIVRLLVWQFSKPVVIANLIAWPIAWWVMRGWLNTFDGRISLTPVPFLLAGGLALAIAGGTIAGHAFRVARANPIDALRYE
ncbi:MAG: ABC transporter permease [Sphingomonas sp.]